MREDLNIYINELAPWEKRNEHYRDIQLGKSIKIQKGNIKSQALKMISSQIASTNSIIASRNIVIDTISDLIDNTESISDGFLEMKAAFEWGISDVVWQIEQASERLINIIQPLYTTIDNKKKLHLREEAEEDYGKGKIDYALESFLELSRFNVYDFSAHMSIGMIYLFHKVDKENALEFFDKAVNYARRQSHYYTSYALLYKALIKRDYGLIEEAENLTKQALRNVPDFTEAMYQNAQYNSLLNKPDKALPLLKEAIKYDTVYCLKINNEQDFEGMRVEINKLLEEVRDERIKKVKDKQEFLEKKIFFLDDTITYITKIGYNVPETFHTGPLIEKNTEAANIIANNSVFDARVAGIVLSQLHKRLNNTEANLRDKCLEIKEDLGNEIYKTKSKISKSKKKGNFLFFLFYILIGQIVAIPIGLATETFSGMVIAEAVLLALCLYWNIILPHKQWKRELVFLRTSEKKLNQIEKRINSVDFFIFPT